MNGAAAREYQRGFKQSQAGPLAAVGQKLEVGLLTGGQDRHYAFGLSMAAIADCVDLDVIGSDLVDGPEMHLNPRLRFLKLHGSRGPAGTLAKIRRTLAFYFRLICYVATTKVKILHILWNNNCQL